MLSDKIKIALGIVGGVIGLGALAFGLSQIVISENANDCKQIGLNGSLVSCSVDEKYAYDRIAILVGNTANSPVPTISEKDKKYIINSYFKNKDNDSFRVDIYSATPSMPKLSYKFDNDTSEDDLSGLVEKYKKITDNINNVIASEPEENGVDYYNSIITLGKKLSKDDDVKKKLLIVIGSGLSDYGTLNFAKNGIPTDVKDVIDKVNQADKIDDEALDGVKVVWSYLGQVKHPQIRLSNSEKQNLERTYEQLADKMGVKDIEFDNDINESKDSVETEYKVNTTKVSDNTVSEWGTKEFSGDNTVLSFLPDSAMLKDASGAASLLDEVALELNNSSNKIVTITSYQARACNGSSMPNYAFLRERSNTIMNLLIEKGVPISKINITDGGFGGSAQCEDQNDRRVKISVS